MDFTTRVAAPGPKLISQKSLGRDLREPQANIGATAPIQSTAGYYSGDVGCGLRRETAGEIANAGLSKVRDGAFASLPSSTSGPTPVTQAAHPESDMPD